MAYGKNDLPTVDLSGNDADDREDRLLHFDRSRMQPVVDAVWAALRAEAVRQNPNINPQDAAARMLCGGCMITFMRVLNERVLYEAHASPRDRERWNRRVAEVIEGDPIESLIMSLIRGTMR